MSTVHRTARPPNFYSFLIAVFALVIFGLFLFGSVAHATVAGEIEASLLTNPLVLGLIVSAVVALLTCLIAHLTGLVAFVQAHSEIKGHEKLTASLQTGEGIVGTFVEDELKTVATAIAAVGPNPTQASLAIAARSAEANGLAKAMEAISGTAIMADMQQLLGAGLDAHLSAVAGAAVTNQLMKAAGPTVPTAAPVATTGAPS